MNVLITGCAGFIGYNIAEKILKKNSKINIIGIDVINSYYSKKLKNLRLRNLKKFKNFEFFKIDILDEKEINYVLKKYKIDYVIHMAAQAGVRYSLKNPKSFLDSNIKGFINLVRAAHKYKVKRFIFASSSSVYGDCKDFPLREDLKLEPKNIYSASKKLNEDISKDISAISKTKFIGLRFFTIYGKFGRPDMFLFKFLKAIFLKQNFYLNNFGDHTRDFTHIDDACNIVIKLLKIKLKKKYYLFNICSNRPIKLNDLISYIKNFTRKKINIIKVKKNKADVLKTHGSNRKIKKILKIKKFKNIFEELDSIIDWYRNNNIYKL